MDGVPHPFITVKPLFQKAANIYKIYKYVIWTGIMRPCIGMALKDMGKLFVSRTFSIDYGKAQLNQSRFFVNIGIEMMTMMDCCEFASQAWGRLSMLKLTPDVLDVSRVARCM